MLVDLSRELGPNAPALPSYPRPMFIPWFDVDVHGYFSRILFTPEHVSTHVDAPAHFVKGGATIDQVELQRFMGRLVVVDMSDLPPRGRLSLRLFEERLPRGVELGPGWIVAFHTGYSRYYGTEKWWDFPVLSQEVVDHLAGLGINAVGTDAHTPDRPEEGYPAHRPLLSKGVLIYERLVNLELLVGRVAQFYGFPIKIEGGSGSPVRAVAIL